MHDVIIFSAMTRISKSIMRIINPGSNSCNINSILTGKRGMLYYNAMHQI